MDSSGIVVGAQLSELTSLTGQVGRAGGTLSEAGGVLAGALAVAGLPAGPATTVQATGEWALQAASGLRRRLAMFEQADHSGGMPTARQAGYGLFASWLPGEPGLGALLDRASGGDKAALTALRQRENAATSSDLAIAVNTWWGSLSTAAQQQLIKSDPGVVGWLDGLPTTARDQANRIVFNSDYAQVQAQIAQLKRETSGDSKGLLGVAGIGSLINDVDGQGAVQAELAHLEGILKGMTAIKAQLEQQGPGDPRVYLLGFNTSDLGHAIVSYGDPDTAQNVVTYVPGLGSGFGSTASGDMSRASRLYGTAKTLDHSASLASIYWLGYNAPQLDLTRSVSALSGHAIAEDSEVAFEADAKSAATSLDSFAWGLNAAHDPAFAAHTVVLGHSYGSLVVGEAVTRDLGQLADDVIFVGSPGVGVNNVQGLHMNGEHVWAGHAAWDEVPDLPPLGDPRLPEWLNIAGMPATEMIGMADPDATHFGIDPSTGPFGARDFQAAPGPALPPLKAHSSYWNPDSVSLYNMARIVDGMYDQVQLVAPQTTAPDLSTPGASRP
jgi:Alpha/beta hydrolase